MCSAVRASNADCAFTIHAYSRMVHRIPGALRQCIAQWGRQLFVVDLKKVNLHAWVVLEVVSQMPGLKILRLRGIATDQMHLPWPQRLEMVASSREAQLVPHFRWVNMQVLDLNECTMPQRTLRSVLHALRGCHNLRELRLDHNDLSAHACGLALAAVLRTNSLKKLGLYNTFWTPAYTWAQLMDCAEGLPTTLETLYFGGDLPRNTAGPQKWTVMDWHDLMQSLAPARCPALREVCFHRIEWHEDIHAIFRVGLSTLTHVRKLDLSFVNLSSDDGLYRALAQMQSLEVLCLEFCKLDRTTTVLASRLGTLPLLRELKLGHNNLEDEQVRQLSSHIGRRVHADAWPALEILHLNANPFEIEGHRSLFASIPGMSSIRRIMLQSDTVSMHGLNTMLSEEPLWPQTQWTEDGGLVMYLSDRDVRVFR